MAKDVWEQLKGKMNEPPYSDNTGIDILELARIFEDQIEVQRRAKSSPIHHGFMSLLKPEDAGLNASNPEFMAAFKEFALAANLEIGEAVEWTQWKSWKKYPEAMSASEVQNCKFELVDCFMFVLNMWLMLGGDAKEFYQFCIAKQQENLRRQQDGYVHAPNDRG